jgi:hypothetical protein
MSPKVEEFLQRLAAVKNKFTWEYNHTLIRGTPRNLEDARRLSRYRVSCFCCPIEAILLQEKQVPSLSFGWLLNLDNNDIDSIMMAADFNRNPGDSSYEIRTRLHEILFEESPRGSSDSQ